MRWALAALCVVVPGVARAAPIAVTVTRGAVVDPSSRTVYVMDDKALVALDLETGKQRWANKQVAMPYGKLGNALVAGAPNGEVVVLDAKTGKPDKQCPTIPGINVRFIDSLGSNSSASGANDGKAIQIYWSSSTHYAGGAAPTPGMEKAARSASSGVYEIDIAACKATAAKTPAATQQPAAPPFACGTLAKDQTMVVSLDGKHQLSSTPVKQNVNTLAICDVATKKIISTFDVEWSPGSFIVIDKLVVEAAYLVTVRDLHKGTLRWRQGIRSTRYMGPYPP